MYNDFQAESVLLSEDMKRKREDMIISKEKDYKVLQPVFDKAGKAISDVTKEKDLICIFDLSEGNKNVLYKSNQSLDLLPLLKAKLGIQ